VSKPTQTIDSLLNTVFTAATDALCIVRDGTLVVANEACSRLFGYPGSMVGLALVSLVAQEEQSRVLGFSTLRATDNTVPKSYLTLGKRQDGSCFDLQVHASAYQLEGQSAVLALLRNIDDEDKRAALLAEESVRFHTLFDHSPDPVWIIDENRFVECNAAAVSMLGYPDKETLQFVHPSALSPPTQPDGEASFTKAERMMRLATANGVHRFEWIHRRADGTDFPAEVTLSSLVLQGRPVIHCVWRDISERYHALSEMRLATSVFHATQEGIMVTDAQAVILSVNPAFSDITGYSAEEAIGQTPRILKTYHQEPEFFDVMWHDLKKNGEWRGELWNRRKNGEAYLEWLTIRAIYDAEGRPNRYVAIFSAVTELRRKDHQIKHQAFHDALTGLPNRFLLHDRLDHAIDLARRNQSFLAVMFLDLDRFKLVNDSLGHIEGDKLLQAVAQRLQNLVRRSDTVARLGGDEFVVVLAGLQNSTEVGQLAEKMLAALGEPFAISDHLLHAQSSIGIAVFPEDGADSASLMKNADTAMYQAKSAGRGTFRFFDSTMNAQALLRLDLEGSLRSAIANRELELFFQPKIEIAGGGLVGAEALLRWHRPAHGTVPPLEFIPIAEETGLIIAIGHWVLEEACRQMALWHRQGLGKVAVAVNVSSRQFRDDTLPEWIAACLDRHELPGESLEIELTESVVMDDPPKSIAMMQRIRQLGVKVSVDDFGTGYSSLAYLKQFPLNAVKIDRSFIADMLTTQGDAAIVESIIALARTLGLNVIAEGVEFVNQMDLLHSLGCNQAQGFLHSTPLPADGFAQWVVGRARQ